MPKSRLVKPSSMKIALAAIEPTGWFQVTKAVANVQIWTVTGRADGLILALRSAGHGNARRSVATIGWLCEYRLMDHRRK
jgi:hypothetical protein